MPVVAVGLFVVGTILALIGGVWLLVKAFQTSILWGLGYLFVPFVSLIFVVLHWDDTKKPFFYVLGGVGFFIVAAILSGDTATMASP